MAFSPDGKRIAAGNSDGTVRVWDAATGRPVGQPMTGHTGSVNSVAFSLDGKLIASGSSDQTVRLWNAASRPTSRPAADRPQGRGTQRGVRSRWDFAAVRQ